jgi:hypothetical protein
LLTFRKSEIQIDEEDLVKQEFIRFSETSVMIIFYFTTIIRNEQSASFSVSLLIKIKIVNVELP